MCFSNYYKKKPKLMVAQEDIQVWKVLNADMSPLYGGKRTNCVMTHDVTTPYEVDKPAKKVKFRMHVRPVCFGLSSDVHVSIDKGYHSFLYKKDAEKLNESSLHERPTVIKVFIIPKGTRYLASEKEIVSEIVIMIA